MTLPIDIWSDIACPWCYVGKRRLEAALARFAHRDAVAIRWHSFQLDPSAPRVQDESVPYAARLARKYRVAVDQAQAMIDRMAQTAAAEGIEMRFDRVRPGNTFDAHRLLHLAAARGAQGALKERLMRAYFTEGEAIGEAEALVRLAAEVGIEPDEAQSVLAGDGYADDVRADLARAAELGIHGVPFFVLANRFAVEGAQPADTMLHVLERAWSEAEKLETVNADGAVCGPDGCE